MDDNIFGVPAGWYPDPLGLPQLRWWDSQAWTEHTSEARAPMVAQSATSRASVVEPAFDPEDTSTSSTSVISGEGLPSRREQRERERRESGSLLADRPLQAEPDIVDDELSAQPLLAMTLRELEPPPADSVEEAAPGPRRASFHANSNPETPLLSALADDLPAAPERAARSLGTYTGAVWAIALMPVIQVLISVLLIVGLGQGSNFALMMVLWVGPYFLVIGFAAFDKLLLQVWGHKRPAKARWSLLGQQAYLIARAVRTWAQTGKGLMPIAFNGAAIVAVLAGILILPGVLISIIPGWFSQEVATSVEADAAALGADFTVECPAPPLLIGDTFACIGTKADGTWDSISVRLTRQSGWIDWRVEDWGPAIMN